MEAVLRIASVRVALEAAAGGCPPFVRMAGDAVLIVADKHAIVVGCFFVKQLRVRKCADDIPVDPALFHKVGINPVHIRIGGWQGEWLLFLFLFLLLRIDNRHPDIRAKQKPDCGRIVRAIKKAACKINRIAAFARILVVP